MLKYYITILFWQFTKTLNQFYSLSWANKNSEICMPVWFEQLNQQIKAVLGTFIRQCFDKRAFHLKNAKYYLCKKLQYVRIYFLYNCHLQWSIYSESIILNYCTLSVLPAIEIKKPKSVTKYLRLTLVFMWNTAHQEKFSFCFSSVFG